MGILYSRSVGTLSAKGIYIFPLDNDDMILNYDVFKVITNIADKGNFDIVQFRGIVSLSGETNILSNNIKNISYTSKKKNNYVLFQPELGKFPLEPGIVMGSYLIKDAYLWGKCISSIVYKKVLNKLGQERYSRYMLAHEDVLIVYALFNTAKSYKFVGKYGIFQISSYSSAYFKTKPFDYYLKELFLADIVLDFSKDIVEHKLLAVHLIIGLMNMKVFSSLLNTNNKKIFMSCFIEH